MEKARDTASNTQYYTTPVTSSESESGSMAATLVMTGLAITAFGLFTGQPLMIAPGMLLVTVVTISGLWSLESVSANVHCRLLIGQHKVPWSSALSGQIVLENRQRLPLPLLRLRVEWPEDLPVSKGRPVPLAASGRLHMCHLLPLRWYERVSRRFSVQCIRRGEHVLGPVEIVFSDPLGIYEQRKMVSTTQRLLVYPRVLDVSFGGSLSREPFGAKAMTSWVFDDPCLGRGVRPYVPSDPFSRIEWKATARAGSLQTRLLDASYSSGVTVVVNTQTEEGVDPAIGRDALERVIVVAASVLNLLSCQAVRLSLHTNGRVLRSPHPASLRYGQGIAHLRACLELLARLRPHDALPCEFVLHQVCSSLPEQASVLLVTSSLSGPLARAVQRQASRGRRVTVVLTADCPPKECSIRVPVFVVSEKGAWDEIPRITLTRARR